MIQESNCHMSISLLCYCLCRFQHEPRLKLPGVMLLMCSIDMWRHLHAFARWQLPLGIYCHMELCHLLTHCGFIIISACSTGNGGFHRFLQCKLDAPLVPCSLFESTFNTMMFGCSQCNLWCHETCVRAFEVPFGWRDTKGSRASVCTVLRNSRMSQ